MKIFASLRPLIATALLLPSVHALGAAPAVQTTPMTVSDIAECARKNLVDRAALRDLAVTATDREGKSHALKMKLYWKPGPKREARVTIRLVEPLPIKGSTYLLVASGTQEDVYFYLPGADRSLKITGQNMSEPLWNTDFSYGEIKQVLGLLAIGDTRRVQDAAVGGRPVYVLETASDSEATGYTRTRTYVDHASCVILKSEFFTKGEQLRKSLEADLSTLLTTPDYNLALAYTMRDLKQGSRTTISLSDFTLQERMPERLFDPKRFFEPFE